MNRTEEEARRLAELEAVRPLAEMERESIRRTVQLCRGNREEAALRLGISARTLYRKLQWLRSVDK